MIASFRRLSKSTVGSIIMVLFVVTILASFAMGDIANLRSGSFGMNSSTLAKVGGQQVTEMRALAADELDLVEAELVEGDREPGRGQISSGSSRCPCCRRRGPGRRS